MDTLVVCWGQDIEWRTEKREREKKKGEGRNLQLKREAVGQSVEAEGGVDDMGGLIIRSTEEPRCVL